MADTLKAFRNVTVEDGCIVVLGTRKRKDIKADRKAREMAAGSGWTPEELSTHFSLYGNRCLRCGIENGLVPDHVTPLYLGGAHNLGNIQPLCGKCNIWKG